MRTALYSISPILIAMVIGYVLGKTLPYKITKFFRKALVPLIWILICSIGYQFGLVVAELSVATRIIYEVLVYASLTTIISWFMIMLIYASGKGKEDNIKSGESSILLPILKDVSVVVGSFCLGVGISTFPVDIINMGNLSLTEILLYTLILIVGIDISFVRLSSMSLSYEMFVIPALVIVGSMLGGGIASLILDEKIKISLALSSGFGWFTLSGVMVSNELGGIYGSIALLVDLFRELFSIVLLYMLGYRFPYECIGTSGAAALDSTLPIIKQTCHSSSFPVALNSGLLLTLFAPFLISFFLS